MLIEIKQKALEKTNRCHSQIIMRVYKNMIQTHNDLCGCEYCCILREYIKWNILQSKMNRIEKHPQIYEFSVSFREKEMIKEKIKELKQKKDLLKHDRNPH